HRLDRLLRVDLRRRRDDRRLDARLRESLVEIRRPVRSSVLLRYLLRRVRASAGEADDLDIFDVLERVEMLTPECSLADDDDFHWVFSSFSIAVLCCRMPTRAGCDGVRNESGTCSTGRREAPSGDDRVR